MKKLFLFLTLLFLTKFVFAQIPETISYQAIIRDLNGALVSQRDMEVELSILQGSESGTEVYRENHFKKSNSNGLVTLNIGSGQAMYNSFSSIDWSQGHYFIETSVKFEEESVKSLAQLSSVPFALQSKDALTVNGLNVETAVPLGAIFTDTQNGSEVKLAQAFDFDGDQNNEKTVEEALLKLHEMIHEIQGSIEKSTDKRILTTEISPNHNNGPCVAFHHDLEQNLVNFITGTEGLSSNQEDGSCSYIYEDNSFSTSNYRKIDINFLRQTSNHNEAISTSLIHTEKSGYEQPVLCQDLVTKQWGNEYVLEGNRVCVFGNYIDESESMNQNTRSNYQYFKLNTVKFIDDHKPGEEGEKYYRKTKNKQSYCAILNAENINFLGMYHSANGTCRVVTKDLSEQVLKKDFFVYELPKHLNKIWENIHYKLNEHVTNLNSNLHDLTEDEQDDFIKLYLKNMLQDNSVDANVKLQVMKIILDDKKLISLPEKQLENTKRLLALPPSMLTKTHKMNNAGLVLGTGATTGLIASTLPVKIAEGIVFPELEGTLVTVSAISYLLGYLTEETEKNKINTNYENQEKQIHSLISELEEISDEYIKEIREQNLNHLDSLIEELKKYGVTEKERSSIKNEISYYLNNDFNKDIESLQNCISKQELNKLINELTEEITVENFVEEFLGATDDITSEELKQMDESDKLHSFIKIFWEKNEEIHSHRRILEDYTKKKDDSDSGGKTNYDSLTYFKNSDPVDGGIVARKTKSKKIACSCCCDSILIEANTDFGLKNLHQTMKNGEFDDVNLSTRILIACKKSKLSARIWGKVTDKYIKLSEMEIMNEAGFGFEFDVKILPFFAIKIGVGGDGNGFVHNEPEKVKVVPYLPSLLKLASFSNQLFPAWIGVSSLLNEILFFSFPNKTNEDSIDGYIAFDVFLEESNYIPGEYNTSYKIRTYLDYPPKNALGGI